MLTTTGWENDDREGFHQRRVIRLHPMVVMGAVIGAVMFYFQGCPVWDVTKVTVAALLLATFVNALLIPATPGTEIRGLGEMYPAERAELVAVFRIYRQYFVCFDYP